MPAADPARPGWWRSRRSRRSLRAQLVALTTLLSCLVAVGLVVVVQLSLAGAASDATQRVLSDRAAALASEIGAASGASTLTVPQAQLDPGVAIYDSAGRQVGGTVPPSLQAEFTALSGTRQQRVIEARDRFTVLALPFATPSGVKGVVVTTEPLAPYENSEGAAVRVCVSAGVLLVVTSAGSAAWISRRVLSPVQQMARTADEWSEHDLERRFALGAPTNEIGALGQTLDGLLEKVASAIRAEQRLTGELAHELRTPLTTISAAADLLAMRADLDPAARDDVVLIRSAAASMSATTNVLLDVARGDAQALRAHRTTVSRLADALRVLPLPPGHLHLDLRTPLVITVPEALVLRALAPILSNAVQAGAQAWVSARQVGHLVVLEVADAGPGISAQHVPMLFEPGWSASGGSGLGLALARRVARSGGGDVALVAPRGRRGGAVFAVSFPCAGLPPDSVVAENGRGSALSRRRGTPAGA